MLLLSLYGATAVMAVSRRCCGGAAAVMADAAAILTLAQPAGVTRGNTAEVVYMFKVSAVPPRRSAMLTVFRGATAINDGTTAEPLRNHCDHGGATTVYAVHVPQWHRASGVTGVEGPRL